MPETAEPTANSPEIIPAPARVDVPPVPETVAPPEPTESLPQPAELPAEPAVSPLPAQPSAMPAISEPATPPMAPGPAPAAPVAADPHPKPAGDERAYRIEDWRGYPNYVCEAAGCHYALIGEAEFETHWAEQHGPRSAAAFFSDTLLDHLGRPARLN